MKPDSNIMQEKRIAESLQGLPTPTMTTNTLTPTTLKNITQIFESEECLNNLQRYNETGGFEPPTVLPVITTTAAVADVPAVTSVDSFLNLNNATVESSSAGLPTVVNTTRTSYANLGSKSWQGGLTTVVTPSQIAMPLPGANANSDDDEDYVDDDKDEDYEPEAKRRSPMVTRRSARSKTVSNKTPVTVSSMPDRAPKRKANNRGGRKPAGDRAIDEESLSPAEKKKLSVRRERNKEAAARCRQRRMDLIEKLSGEVEVWEGKRKSLEEEIQMLTSQRDELEFILQAHSQICKLPINKMRQQTRPQQVVAVKSEPPAAAASPVIVEPVNAAYIVPEVAPVTIVSSSATSKPSRPLSLALSTPKAVSPKVQGVDIETPSAIVSTGINFDSLVGTGLTPTVVYNTIVTPVGNTLNTPTCSKQHHQQTVDSALVGPEYLQL